MLQKTSTKNLGSSSTFRNPYLCLIVFKKKQKSLFRNVSSEIDLMSVKVLDPNSTTYSTQVFKDFKKYNAFYRFLQFLSLEFLNQSH